MLQLGSRIFWAQFIALCLFSALHLFASHYDLYDTMWWIDIPVHFLAGVWVGLAAFWLGKVAGRPVRNFWAIFMSVLAIGILWEVYEFIFHISGGPHYAFDTAKDICDDVLGGAAAYFLAGRFFMQERTLAAAAALA